MKIIFLKFSLSCFLSTSAFADGDLPEVAVPPRLLRTSAAIPSPSILTRVDPNLTVSLATENVCNGDEPPAVTTGQAVAISPSGPSEQPIFEDPGTK